MSTYVPAATWPGNSARSRQGFPDRALHRSEEGYRMGTVFSRRAASFQAATYARRRRTSAPWCEQPIGAGHCPAHRGQAARAAPRRALAKAKARDGGRTHASRSWPRRAAAAEQKVLPPRPRRAAPPRRQLARSSPSSSRGLPQAEQAKAAAHEQMAALKAEQAGGGGEARRGGSEACSARPTTCSGRRTRPCWPRRRSRSCKLQAELAGHAAQARGQVGARARRRLRGRPVRAAARGLRRATASSASPRASTAPT